MSLLPLLHGLGVIVGLFFLIKGSDWIVEGAASLALKKGVSQHLIGLTLVAFATSLPELATTIASRSEGEVNLAVGNILGSNVANIGLVLGIAAIILPIGTNREVKRDAIFMLLTTILLAGLLYWLGGLNIIMGLLFLALYGVYLYYLRKGFIKEKKETPLVGKYPIKKEIILIVVGFLSITIGAQLLVKNSVKLAYDLNVGTGVIGLTIVAVGTSFPELATSITATIKKNEGIAIGNVLGSNIINMLLILGILGTTYGIHVEPVARYLINKSLLLFLVIAILEFFFSRKTQGRIQGILLFSLYVVFLYIVI